MAKREKTFWLKRFFGSSWFFVIILALLLLFSSALVREMMRKMEVQKEINELEKKVADFNSQNQELESLIAYWRTEEFVEKEARTKLGYKKPGETVVAVPESSEYVVDDASITAAGNAGHIFIANWQLWWSYFFDK